ncbi:hypothetical protein RvY_09219 [Ramazzottius varieornatus]|uniref:RRM domain-containing protein n=1 Tax=Ramazzottius varieornatus TaxID=947166 RepID=A0A1D1VB27_RAMVA|nr:hypothetical protein RvY_09219 [Ramazzottius varieornatus]
MADEVKGEESSSAVATVEGEANNENGTNGGSRLAATFPSETAPAKEGSGETTKDEAAPEQGTNDGNQKNQNGRAGWKHNQRKNRDSRFNPNDNKKQNNSNSPRSPEKNSGNAVGNNKNDQDDQGKKFTTQSRLFVGNLTPDTTEDDLVKMFTTYTVAPDVFLDKQKMYAFVRLDTRQNAETAKNALDGTTFKGRVLRVRFATFNAGIRVKNLGPNVSNELLHRAFERFGPVDKAVVEIDDKSKPTGEGVVYFARKPGAQQALKQVNSGVFLLGGSPRPVIAEMLEQKDSEDGLPEVHMAMRKEYVNETSQPPHFALPGSLEHDFGMRWKRVLDEHQARARQIEIEFKNQIEHLENEMEHSVDDIEINKIKQNIAAETLKMQQLLERTQRARGNKNSNSSGSVSNQFSAPQQLSMMQSGMNNQLAGLPVPPPGFPAGLPGVARPAIGAPQSNRPFGEPFGVGMSSGQNIQMLLAAGNGFSNPGVRPPPGQFGGSPQDFDQSQFNPNIAGLGQRNPDGDFKRFRNNNFRPK